MNGSLPILLKLARARAPALPQGHAAGARVRLHHLGRRLQPLWRQWTGRGNHCGKCINAHVHEVKKAGIANEGIQSSVRVASVINAAAQSQQIG